MAAHNPYHHHLVVLQGQYYDMDVKFNFPPSFTYSITTYPETSPDELHARIHDATIIIMSWMRLDATALSEKVTPRLKFISVVAVGTDGIDLETCRRRGIVVSNCPNANVESVSEHALGLYFAARRRTVQMMGLARSGKWAELGGRVIFEMEDRENTAPLTCGEEIAGIIGYGAVGQRISRLVRNLGMKVLVSGRKDPNAAHTTIASNLQRVPFEEVIEKSTVIFVAVPRTSNTWNMISTAEFQSMSPHTVLVNVARGGIVDEVALVTALRQRQISGAATDVLANEPGSPESSPLLGEDTKDLNLTVSPHIAWVSRKTIDNYVRMVQEHVESFAVGKPRYTVVP